MSIFRYLYIRIRESILSISLSSRLSRAIGQSPYRSRVLAVTSRYVYRPSVVQLLIWVFVCMCLIAFYLLLHCSRVSLRVYLLPFYIGDHGAIFLIYFIFDYQIVFLYTALSLLLLVFHLRSSRSIKNLGP